MASWRLAALLLSLRVAAFGAPRDEAARARSTLIVAPADGARVYLADGAATAGLRILLDGPARARVCVVTILSGRAPAPEACLADAGSVDLSNVPPGAHAFTIRDATTLEAATVAVSVAARAAGAFYPTREWRPVGASAPPGLDIRLPLDGAPKMARIPDPWRLQLYATPPPGCGRAGFWRADVFAAAAAASLEAALAARWPNCGGATLALEGFAAFHPNATAESLDLFSRRRDLVVRWPDGPDRPPPLEANVAAVLDAAKASANRRPDEPDARPPEPTPEPPEPTPEPPRKKWAGGGPLRIVRPPAAAAG